MPVFFGMEGKEGMETRHKHWGSSFHTSPLWSGRYGKMNMVHEEFELQEAPRVTAEEARQEFPGVAAVVDEFKAVFGGNVKVVAFEERGLRHEVKQYKPESEYGGRLGPTDFIRLGEISRENTAMLAKREADRGKK
jgi:hypothetical protein